LSKALSLRKFKNEGNYVIDELADDIIADFLNYFVHCQETTCTGTAFRGAVSMPVENCEYTAYVVSCQQKL
ncbi:hypothetical protein LWS67_24480, partial [Bacillus atrophaeus]|uniref:hypothetical protein n=1 Tax=Bacillus atrophaeus TaxID=1452 RepID=UPI001EFA50AE